MYAQPDNHHGAGREGVWIKAHAENQRLMVRAEPKRYFVPPYVGPKGWVGVFLDGPPAVDWETLGELLRDAWVATAPAKLRGRD